MPPETNSPYLTNDELLDIIKQAPIKYAEEAKEMDKIKSKTAKIEAEMRRYLAEDLKKASGHSPYVTGNFDRQYQEQKAFTDMEGRITAKMQQEIRRIEDAHLMSMASLEKAVAIHQKGVEELITALVEQNRELSRRVTDLEWEGINP